MLSPIGEPRFPDLDHCPAHWQGDAGASAHQLDHQEQEQGFKDAFHADDQAVGESFDGLLPGLFGHVSQIEHPTGLPQA